MCRAIGWFVVLGVSTACDPPRDPDASPPSAAAAGTEQPRVRTAPGTRPATTASPRAVVAAPIEFRLAEVRDRGETVEIEIAFDHALPGGDGMRPTLQVGDEIVQASLHPQGRADRLVFLVPRDQFARMPDGAALTVRIRGRSSAALAQAPVLDKSKAVTP